MAHCRLLFVGSRDDLQKIYDDCPDSSSETSAEMAIGADWISDYDWIDEDERRTGTTTDDFTKENKKLYEQILKQYVIYY